MAHVHFQALSSDTAAAQISTASSPPPYRLLLCAGLALLGCGGRTEQPPSDLGQLALRLTAVSVKAEEYRLTNASFQYAGPSEGTFSVPAGDPSYRAILPVGDYNIALLDGWRLERASAAGLVPVAAELTSTNPASFSILPAQVSPLAFQFRTGTGLVSTEGVLELNLGVDDADDPSAGNGCPQEFCGPLTLDFEDQPTGIVPADEYADYFTLSASVGAPVEVHVVSFAGGHSVCADAPNTGQCHFELDISFARPVEGLSLTLVNSSTVIVTHAQGTTSRTALTTGAQSFAELHGVTRIQSIPIGALGSVRSLTFSIVPRVD